MHKSVARHSGSPAGDTLLHRSQTRGRVMATTRDFSKLLSIHLGVDVALHAARGAQCRCKTSFAGAPLMTRAQRTNWRKETSVAVASRLRRGRPGSRKIPNRDACFPFPTNALSRSSRFTASRSSRLLVNPCYKTVSVASRLSPPPSYCVREGEWGIPPGWGNPAQLGNEPRRGWWMKPNSRQPDGKNDDTNS